MRAHKEKSLLRFRRAAARNWKRPNHRQLGACAEAQKILSHSRASGSGKSVDNYRAPHARPRRARRPRQAPAILH